MTEAYQSKKYLTRDRESPSDLAANKTHPVVEEVAATYEYKSKHSKLKDTDLITIPTPTSNGSLQTSLPRFFASQSSAWYIGTVEVSMPVPMPVIKRATIRWGTENAEACSEAPTCSSKTMQHGISNQRFAYNDPPHCEPHGTASSEPIPKEEVDDATREAAKVVNGDDDASQAIVRVLHGFEKV